MGLGIHDPVEGFSGQVLVPHGESGRGGGHASLRGDTPYMV
jgi:hypothetical protein